jgi:hypothetical protein
MAEHPVFRAGFYFRTQPLLRLFRLDRVHCVRWPETDTT